MDAGPPASRPLLLFLPAYCLILLSCSPVAALPPHATQPMPDARAKILKYCIKTYKLGGSLVAKCYNMANHTL
ncbi:hypothetical protein R3P38DRAFT_3120085 [Favolaschia claudopus]|uniref:Uncharacterized protein n=1 Tax=Favolaschia claudopus TaxID=2862362 RepID=A0AAV9ZDK9_9AGAR